MTLDIISASEFVADTAPPQSTSNVPRSSRKEVRNPLILLPSAQAFKKLPPECRAAMRALLKEMRADLRKKAEHSWRKSKAPVAAYHKAMAVYAGHIYNLLKEDDDGVR